MIRLPPTSIFLSENDIQFHIQQLEIYHGLLKQGFSKEDISRYLEDYRKNTLQETEPLTQIEATRAPSTLDFACRDKKETPSLESFRARGKDKETSRSSVSFEPCTSDEDASELFASSDIGTNLNDTEEDSGDENQSVSPVAMPPKIHLNKHAPRQSSLLRFSTAVSPDHQSNTSQLSQTPQMTASIRTRRYRPRSQTYPYLSSEREQSSGATSEPLTERIARLSLEESGLSERTSTSSSDGLSLPPPPPFLNTLRRRPTFAALRSSIGRPGSPEEHLGNSSAPNDLLSTGTLLHPLDPQIDIPSSPPVHNSSSSDVSTPLPARLGSPDWPATPIPSRRPSASAQTESGDHGPRYLDGSGFSVYNDALPATSQPQTPADMSRTRLITERDAAYTAPPGMIRFGSFSITPREPSEFERNFGEQSPTLRAINMRERRSRELWRSMRAESARMRRNRLREDALFDETTPGNPRARRRHRELDEPWRDELDADRVGEENFETDFSIRQGGVMRVVSGNARGEA
jgi:hypothetical protein